MNVAEKTKEAKVAKENIIYTSQNFAISTYLIMKQL